MIIAETIIAALLVMIGSFFSDFIDYVLTVLWSISIVPFFLYFLYGIISLFLGYKYWIGDYNFNFSFLRSTVSLFSGDAGYSGYSLWKRRALRIGVLAGSGVGAYAVFNSYFGMWSIWRTLDYIFFFM